MADISIISIDGEGISAASAQASSVERKISGTADELSALKKQLASSQNSLEDYFGFCFNEVIPTKELQAQSLRLKGIVSALEMADELKNTENSFIKEQVENIQLIVSGIGSLISIIAGKLTGDKDGGDVYAEVEFGKGYTNSSKNWSKKYNGAAQDYSDFSVVASYKENYVLNQRNYYNGEIACSATCDAIVASIVSGETETPDKSYWNSSNQCIWPNTKKVAGSDQYSVSQKCEYIYSQVQEGNPVIISLGGAHYVVAIGVRQGVDISNITADDILVIDPGDAKVKTANEVYSGWSYGSGTHLTMASGSLRVAK